VKQRFWDFIIAAPFAMPAALAAFGIVVIPFLLLEQFKGIFIWPLGLIAFVVTWIAISKCTVPLLDKEKTSRWCTIIILVGAALWGVGNSFYAGQHVFTNRDPAAYALTGVWLSQNESVKIDKQEVLGNVANTTTDSGGFITSYTDGDHLYARGPHLFPAFLALAGKIHPQAIFWVNSFIGALAIIAFYGLVRLIVSARWALLATLSFALTLPLIYFSRDTYTEPLSAVFFLGSLSLLLLAIKSQKAPLLWAAAGITAGAGALVRIDTLLPIAGLILFAGIYIALHRRSARFAALRNIGWLLGSAALPIVLGWLNFSLLTGRYFDKHLSPYLLQVYLIGAVIVFVTIVVIVAWRTSFFHWLEKISRSWRVPICVGLVVAAATFLASRPLWHVGYSGTVRSYAELTLNWVAWYIGPLLLLFGFFGICLALVRLVKAKKLNTTYLALLSVILIPTTIYLVQPSIAADHIWASRRLLPIAIPAFILFSTVALAWLYTRTQPKSIARNFLYIIAFVALISPLATSLPFLKLRPYAQMERMTTVCDTLPEHATIVWVGTARTEAIQPTRLFCHNQSTGYGRAFAKDKPSLEDLKTIAKQAKSEQTLPLIGLYSSDRQLIPATSKFTELSSVPFYDVQSTITSAPYEISANTSTIFIGIIQEDGAITPL
jgi:hypothetical protein